MSGHSKWSTIKRQKAVTDSKRSAAFTKLARLITVAARQGGGDPSMNFRLRLAIDKAKASNVPNDTIDRAIKIGTGEGKAGDTKDVIYEGFGPGGVATMVEAITDNSNRTAAEVRSVFTKHGGTLGTQNSVGWMFTRAGLVQVPLSTLSPEQRESLELSLIDHEVSDIREEGGRLMVVAPLEKLADVRNVCVAVGLAAEAEVAFLPTTTTAIDDATTEKLHTFFEALEDLDDVTHVWSNEI